MEKSKILTTKMLQKISAKIGDIKNSTVLNKGLTNSLFLLSNQKGQQFVAKVFSNIEGLLFHRKQEVYLNNFLWQQQLTTELLLEDKEFFLFNAVQGENLTEKQLQETVMQEIIKIINIINNINIGEYNFFHRDFLQTGYAYSNPLSVETKKNPMVINTLNLLRTTLANIAIKFPIELAVCHNDYNLDNFMITSAGKLLVIDFEYSSVNDIYFEYATLNFMLGRKFDLFLKLYNKPINFSKLQHYITVLDCLSILWCFLMHEKRQDKNFIDYLGWADEVYQKLSIEK